MSQAKSALAMQKATETVQQKMKKHKADVSETLFLEIFYMLGNLPAFS